MNLLTLRIDEEDSVLFFPWEQDAPTRARLDAHAHACPRCVRHRLTLFDTSVRRDNVIVSCSEGREIALLMFKQRLGRA